MRDVVELLVARDPIELEAARDLLARAGIVHSLRAPFAGLETVCGGMLETPATICVARADLERARAVLAEAWGAQPEPPA